MVSAGLNSRRSSVAPLSRFMRNACGFFFGLRNEFFNVRLNKKWLFNRTSRNIQVTKQLMKKNDKLFFVQWRDVSWKVPQSWLQPWASRSKRIGVTYWYFFERCEKYEKRGVKILRPKCILKFKKISQLFKTRNLSNHGFHSYI